MYTTFGTITQPFIKDTLKKKKTRVLALLMLYDTRATRHDSSWEQEQKKQRKLELLWSYFYVIIVEGKSSSTLISYG